MELGWWFNRGQEVGREPLFSGMCAMCGVLLHQYHGVSNTCYGHPMNRDGELLRTGTGAPRTDAQPPFLFDS